jgi:hypothetical protein
MVEHFNLNEKVADAFLDLNRTGLRWFAVRAALFRVQRGSNLGPIWGQ